MGGPSLLSGGAWRTLYALVALMADTVQPGAHSPGGPQSTGDVLNQAVAIDEEEG